MFYKFIFSDAKEVDIWIDRINFVAALLSAPSLASAVSSERNFHRPHLPATYTKLNMVNSIYMYNEISCVNDPYLV